MNTQSKWENDPSIGDRLRGWLRDWSTYLLSFTLLSGSSFAAINLVNVCVPVYLVGNKCTQIKSGTAVFFVFFFCVYTRVTWSCENFVVCVFFSFQSRVFGHPLFCMGLSYRHLKKFENQRLYSVIVAENVPQLVIQIWFAVAQGELDQTTILAMISGTLSIVWSVVDVLQSRKLFATTHDYNTVFRIPCESADIMKKRHRLALATHRFNGVFAAILGVDPFAIEVDLPTLQEHGLIINFSVSQSKTHPRALYAALDNAHQRGQLARVK